MSIRRSVAELDFSVDECWVGAYQADVNAALNVADRYRSGESQSRTDRDSGQKVTGDDSATDGATRQPRRC